MGDLIIKYDALEENLNKLIQTTFSQHKIVVPAPPVSSSDPNTPLKSAHSFTVNSPEIKSVNFQFDLHQQQQQHAQNLLLSINNFKVYLLEDNERIKLNTLIAIIDAG